MVRACVDSMPNVSHINTYTSAHTTAHFISPHFFHHRQTGLLGARWLHIYVRIHLRFKMAKFTNVHSFLHCTMRRFGNEGQIWLLKDCNLEQMHAKMLKRLKNETENFLNGFSVLIYPLQASSRSEIFKPNVFSG